MVSSSVISFVLAFDFFEVASSMQNRHTYVTEDPVFRAFLDKHGRNYTVGTDEYTQRLELFQKSHDEVQRHNSQSHRLWTAGINHLSDWTEAELQTLFGYAGHPVSQTAETGAYSYMADSVQEHVGSAVVSESVVWNNPALAQIENQGHCGSCWAEATAKMAEANYFIATNESRSFSVQELVDCVPNPQTCGGQGGCRGATVELAMHYMSQKGCATKQQKPYIAQDRTCTNPADLSSFLRIEGETKAGVMSMTDLVTPGIKMMQNAAAHAIKLVSWERLPENREAPLLEALMHGTVAVSVAASAWPWYHGGIFNGCGADAIINHAVLAMGYGTDAATGSKFWLIQNSWGQYWGEYGRIRVLRTNHVYCGIDSKPQDGTGCKGGPKSVKVCGMCGVLYDSVIAKFGK